MMIIYAHTLIYIEKRERALDKREIQEREKKREREIERERERKREKRERERDCLRVIQHGVACTA